MEDLKLAIDYEAETRRILKLWDKVIVMRGEYNKRFVTAAKSRDERDYKNAHRAQELLKEFELELADYMNDLKQRHTNYQSMRLRFN